MGTTLVGLLHVEQPASAPESKATGDPVTIRPKAPTLWLGHVGDSRCYLYRNRQLTQLTEDHSLVEEQVRAGQITAAAAAMSPMRTLITRAVGSHSTVDVDIQALRTLPGDLYLLASDGLTRELGDEDIATVLADIHTGGRDNITVLLLAFPQGVERRKTKHT